MKTIKKLEAGEENKIVEKLSDLISKKDVIKLIEKCPHGCKWKEELKLKIEGKNG